MTNEIWSYIAHLIEGLIVVLGSVLLWIWSNDRKDSRDRITKLEVKVSDLQINNVTRIEFHDKVDSVQTDYRDDHKGIISAIGECNRILREDISEIRKMLDRRHLGKDE